MLSIDSSDDVLAWVGAIGLAVVCRTALIVDARFAHPPTRRTLADLAEAGPRLDELSPGRGGVATIFSGGLGGEALGEIVDRLASSWPAVVVRGSVSFLPLVPYRPIYPGALQPERASAAVWQPVAFLPATSLPGRIMPRLGRGATLAMLHGRSPGRGRWVKAWREVWGLPWA